MSIAAVGSSGLSQAEAAGRMHLAGRVARGMVAEQDADRNGALSLGETGLSEPSFTAIDGDGNGLVTRRELVNGLKDRKEELRATLLAGPDGQGAKPADGAQQIQGHLEALASSVAAGLDGDGDGTISVEESGLTAEGFGKVDGNGDGILTAPEIASAIRDKRDEAGYFTEVAGTGNANLAAPDQAAGDAPPPEDASPESAMDKPQQQRLRQALAAYQGSMGQLMSGLFERSPSPPAPTGTASDNGSESVTAATTIAATA